MEFLFIGFLFTIFVTFALALFFRRVVPTNEVHIIQSGKNTTSYGKDSGHGNVYYQWPSWLPRLGITSIQMPTAVFPVNLKDYEAYDNGRLPFAVDVTAFFRISDSNIAAQRVSSFSELVSQLTTVVQGSIRSVLGRHEIEEIMHGRATFGEAFTNEVNEQLANWGVVTVKNIELMDIRDGDHGHAIENIMAKKKSEIESQSRQEVAKNKRAAEVAEIEAKREVDLQAQQAKQAVGLRTVEAEREVELSKQQATQQIKETEKVTKEKEMAVIQVAEVKKAEITREINLVKADQERQQTVIAAEAQLEKEKRQAEGTEAQGVAEAAAEKAKQLAPVEAQIVLAKEIGTNTGYQQYLITLRRVEAEQIIGVEQAKALDKADIKIIANTGSAPDGIKSVSELFSSKGGTQIGAMLEGMMNTETGKAALKTLGVNSNGALQ